MLSPKGAAASNWPDQGTLFLDEIGDTSIDLQPKLLRAIQEREFERIGSSRTIQVDVRLIAATHQNLQQMIREGTFREDLFYRLNVFPIEVAPLRERREDIPLLVEYFVSRCCRRMQKPVPAIRRATMDALMAWDWPGNVRELEDFLERAVILTSEARLNAPLAELASSGLRVTPVLSFRDGERNTIIAALKASRGKIAGKDGAAALLGLKRTTLWTNCENTISLSVNSSANLMTPCAHHASRRPRTEVARQEGSIPICLQRRLNQATALNATKHVPRPPDGNNPSEPG